MMDNYAIIYIVVAFICVFWGAVCSIYYNEPENIIIGMIVGLLWPFAIVFGVFYALAAIVASLLPQRH